MFCNPMETEYHYSSLQRQEVGAGVWQLTRNKSDVPLYAAPWENNWLPDPTRLTVFALRIACSWTKGVSDTYIDMNRDIYHESRSMLWTAVGDTKPFPVTIGVHKGSVYSPFLFSVILDALSNSIRDITLADANRSRLVWHRKAWKEALENGGLKLNVTKIEYLVVHEASFVTPKCRLSCRSGL